MNMKSKDPYYSHRQRVNGMISLSPSIPNNHYGNAISKAKAKRKKSVACKILIPYTGEAAINHYYYQDGVKLSRIEMERLTGLCEVTVLAYAKQGERIEINGVTLDVKRKYKKKYTITNGIETHTGLYANDAAKICECSNELIRNKAKNGRMTSLGWWVKEEKR